MDRPLQQLDDLSEQELEQMTRDCEAQWRVLQSNEAFLFSVILCVAALSAWTLMRVL